LWGGVGCWWDIYRPKTFLSMGIKSPTRLIVFLDLQKETKQNFSYSKSFYQIIIIRINYNKTREKSWKTIEKSVKSSTIVTWHGIEQAK
jgi:hypothetical protein